MPRLRRHSCNASVSVPAIAVTVAVITFLLGVTIASAVVLPVAQPSSAVSLPVGAIQLTPAIEPSQVPITHFILVVQENHAYDNFFGTYCLVTGSYCADNATGIPPGTCVPYNPSNVSQGCIKPYPYPSENSITSDPAHTRTSSLRSYNNGSMNGFYAAENGNRQVFGYFNGTTIPTYWDLAEEYGLSDHWFSTDMGYSLPEHWSTVATYPPQITLESGVAGKLGVLSPSQIKYLNEANKTATIEDLLANTSVSWKYYDYALPTYQQALDTIAGGECKGGEGAFNYWNPMAARAESYTPAFSSHFVPRDQIFADLANGTLPNVSYVIPNCVNSDHPPEPPSGGQDWIAQLVNSLEASPDWNSTALFITFDEYGGFYDNLAPAQLNTWGLGFRVPLIVVSPYSRESYVSHDNENFQSFLRLIEWRFGLNVSTGFGSHLSVPLGYFDFHAPPRAPWPVGAYPNATYPAMLQPIATPGAVTDLTAHATAMGVALSWTPAIHGGAPAAYRVVAEAEGGLPLERTFLVDGAASAYNLTGLPGGLSYRLTVTAVTDQKTGPPRSVDVWFSGTIEAPVVGASVLAPFAAVAPVGVFVASESIVRRGNRHRGFLR